MRMQPDLEPEIEPERYELCEPPAYEFEINRRDFVGATAAGLLITVFTRQAAGQRGATRTALGARLHLAEDGTVTVFSGKVEVGQGSRVEIAMAAAEELRLPLERVRVVLADTDLVPDDGITAGSRTTPATIPAVRRAAAAVRGLLAEAAAREWGAARAALAVRDGAVLDPASQRRFTYADLARSASLAQAYKAEPPAAALTPANEWRLLGRSQARLDGRAIVTGAHRFPSDIVRPGMLYGAILRPPAYNAVLASIDLAPAEKLPGVKAVREGAFVGCVAPTSWEARRAVAAIGATAKWETRDHPSSDQLFEWLKQHAVAEQGGNRRPRIQTKGSVEQGLAQAARRVKGVFEVPYIQHAPMEPRAAVAEWNGARLTVWTGTQNPHGVRSQLQQAFHLSSDNVRVIVPDTGGAFGGKHTGEAAIEAARLAREAGRPVLLRWTRAEEFMWAYFRPAGLYEIEAGLDAQGLLTAWDFTVYNAGAAAIESPYRLDHTRTRFFYCDSPLREGSYRGIAATANNFARECFMDELAAASGSDPLAFRLAHLDNERLRAVLKAAAELFRWEERRKQRRPGMGAGVACGTEKGSVVAICALVQADAERGALRVLELVTAFECGAIVNPENLKAQVEGCIIQGLGGALMEQIRFHNGRLDNGSFAHYRVPRFRDVPPMKTLLLDRKDLPPAGAGETPIIGVAPAIANAVFDAVGIRVRAMPVRLRAAKS